MHNRQNVVDLYLPQSENFGNSGTRTQVIVVVLSIAIVLFEVLPISNMVSATSLSLSTIKSPKAMKASKTNQIATSYAQRWDSDEHIITVIFNLSTANSNDRNIGNTFATERQPSSSSSSSSPSRTGKRFNKRIIVVDDEPDVVLTFKIGLDGHYYDYKKRFEIYAYNSPIEALSNFKRNFYDLMLVDVYMPDMNGFELSQKILELDANVRICFMSAAEVNIQALREVYPNLSFGCFIKKPVTIEYLVERLNAELD